MSATIRYYHGEIFESRGYSFRVQFQHDENHEPPWENDCGRGIVSDWTQRDKRPGERVLCEDRHSSRFYDVEATIKLARKDGWGTTDGKREGESPRAYAMRAVEEDFEFLSAWCRDVWSYVGVIVAQVDEEGNPLGPVDSLWGVETWKDYHCDVVRELTDELLRRLEVDEPDVVLSEN